MTATTLGTIAPAPPPVPDQLDALLRRMRLPYLRKAAPDVLATARAQRWDPAEVIRILLEEEVRGRDEAGRRIRRKAAGLPAGKTFASWREADSSIPLPAQHALMTLEWVTRAENLAVAGPRAPGNRTSPRPSRTRPSTPGCGSPGSPSKRSPPRSAAPPSTAPSPGPSRRSPGADLIVIDDIGMLPAGQAAGEAFYRLIDAAYERRSVIVTSNLHPSGFDTIMPKTLATATVDRLLHHAHLVTTEGTSLRLAEATTGKGVIPLT